MSSNKWLGLSALIPGLAMVFLDQTILPVALPTIQAELGSSDVALQWAVNSYLLAIAVFVLIGGKLSDRIGHRRSFLMGISLFALSSALCGLAPTVEFLIVVRFLQGIGAALLFPAQTALLNLIVAPHERGRMIGFNVSIGSLFLMLGPLIGGYLTEWVSWRWIFWINLPIAVIGVLLTLFFLPSPAPRKEKIDLWGFLYFAICCSSLITLLMQGADWGWLSSEMLGLGLIAIVSGIFLLRREAKSMHPFLDLALFKHSTFASINLSISMVQFIMMITVFRAIYFQETLSYSPSWAGILTFVSTAPVLFLSPLGGYLSDHVSPKLPIALGFLCLIGSFFWFGFSPTPGFAVLILISIVFGMGIPLVLTPSYSSAMGSVPAKKLGTAFGMVATLRNFSATLGLALINLFVSAVEKSKGQIVSFSRVHFVLGFLMILAFACAFLLYNRKSAHHLPEAPAEGWD